MATISSPGSAASGCQQHRDPLVRWKNHPLKIGCAQPMCQAQLLPLAKFIAVLCIGDVATRIADTTVWGGRIASSANSSAATITASASASATRSRWMWLLALQQSTHPLRCAWTALGAGTRLQLGNWSSVALRLRQVLPAVCHYNQCGDTVATLAVKSTPRVRGLWRRCLMTGPMTV